MNLEFKLVLLTKSGTRGFHLKFHIYDQNDPQSQRNHYITNLHSIIYNNNSISGCVKSLPTLVGVIQLAPTPERARIFFDNQGSYRCPNQVFDEYKGHMWRYVDMMALECVSLSYKNPAIVSERTHSCFSFVSVRLPFLLFGFLDASSGFHPKSSVVEKQIPSRFDNFALLVSWLSPIKRRIVRHWLRNAPTFLPFIRSSAPSNDIMFSISKRHSFHF